MRNGKPGFLGSFSFFLFFFSFVEHQLKPQGWGI